ncbi:MAG TPA: LytTR family DNA-binding domain-containing protein [Bacteroidia bacterium]|jgi:DNA-binding LytR/AlgR family response regulator|nr:LytTR family DNA-binding domain-containing protein [Bacteroidia bacterium]
MENATFGYETSPMNCIIIDDNEVARAAVKHCVEKTPFLTLTGVYTNPIEALEAIKSEKPDLLLLDVEMPEMSGIDFIKTFHDIPQVILITSKKEYAAEAFDFNVTDYILKPVEYPRFLKAVTKAKEMQESLRKETPESNELFIKVTNKFVHLNLNDILVIEALADYVNIYVDKQRYTVLSTMKAIEDKLPKKDFIRVHRSYIVRIDKIKEIDDQIISIADQHIPISRNMKDPVMNALNKL